MVEHVLTTTSNQLIQLASTVTGGTVSTSPVWLPSDIVILTRKLRLTPYHGGKALTILDFVSLVHVHSYLMILQTNNQLPTYAGALSNILEWFDRIQNTGEWKRAISADLGFVKHADSLKQFALTSCPTSSNDSANESSCILDIRAMIPGSQTPQAFKKLQEHVKGPRCDWVTDKKRNHHLVKTPYESLLVKLSEAHIEVPDDNFLPANTLDLGLDETLLPWTSIPYQLDPAHGSLNAERASRKRQQISNIIHYVSRLLRDGSRIVDFCGGGGHISLVLAWLFPKVHVILIDRNEVSLSLAQKRKQELEITNLEILCSDVQLWKSGKFDVGVAIHACGSLSDIIMEKCIESGASYVMAPCCFGSLQNCDTSVIRLPRSDKYAEAGVTLEDYMSLASVADINTSGVSLESTQYKTGRKAMGIIDHDRNLRASQDGYSTFQFTMRPPTCTPKNEIICGISVGFKDAQPEQNANQFASPSFFNSEINGLTVRRVS